MAGEIGQAYVRIRPNTRGFKSETEAGVKSTFEGIAKLAGLAFGAKEAFDFGKEIVSHAADVQKQIENVRSQFGAASEEILKFGETADKSLGLSEHAVEATASRFGIIFNNLGIGQEQAAQMTIGFEKLAGSLALIRNVDPSVILKNIPLAVQGNLRSLKQLGIATDQNQLKLAAYKLGLISSVKEGLTPATRAQAIYAIATAHLSEFQADAARHAGDAATQQKILSAEWDNAKDKLGVELLPELTKATTYLATNLPHAIDATIKEFHSLRDTFGPAIHAGTEALGGFKAALRDVLVVWLAWRAALKAERIINATSALAGTTKVMLGLEKSTKQSAVAAKALQGRLAALGAIGAITVTLIIAEKVAGNVKNLQEQLLGAKDHLATPQIEKALVPRLAAEIKKARAAGESTKELLEDLRARPSLGNKNEANQLIAEAFRFNRADQRKDIEAGWKKAISEPSKKGIKDAGADIADQISKLAKQQDAAVTKARGDLKQLGMNLGEAIKQQVEDVRDSVRSAKSNLTSISQSLADSLSQVIDKPLQDEQNRLSSIGNRQNLENIRRSAILPGGRELSKDPKKALAELQSLSKQGNNVNRGAIQQFILQYRQALLSVRQDQANVTKEAATKRISDLTDSLNRGTISVGTYKKRVLALLTADHVSYKRAGALLGSAFANGFKDQVKGLVGQASAIAAVPDGKFTAETNGPTIVRPLETLHRDQVSIGKIQHQIGNKTNSLLARIAKDTKAQADLTKKLADLQLGSLPSKDKNPGRATKRAKRLNATTG